MQVSNHNAKAVQVREDEAWIEEKDGELVNIDLLVVLFLLVVEEVVD